MLRKISPTTSSLVLEKLSFERFASLTAMGTIPTAAGADYLVVHNEVTGNNVLNFCLLFNKQSQRNRKIKQKIEKLHDVSDIF